METEKSTDILYDPMDCWLMSCRFFVHHVSLSGQRVCTVPPDPGSGPGAGPGPSCSRIQSGSGTQSGVPWTPIFHVWIFSPAASPWSSQLVWIYYIDFWWIPYWFSWSPVDPLIFYWSCIWSCFWSSIPSSAIDPLLGFFLMCLFFINPLWPAINILLTYLVTYCQPYIDLQMHLFFLLFHFFCY